MKYIKKFENFVENKTWSKIYENASDDLIDELSDDTIEEYYDKHYTNDDVEELVSLWPDLIWRHIDDESFVEDFINDEINNLGIEDVSNKDDLRDFIEDNLTTKKENKIIELWKDKQDDNKNNDKVSKIDGTVSIIKDDEYKIIITSNDGIIKNYKIPEPHEILVDDGQIVSKGTTLSTLAYDDDMLADLDEDELREVIEDSGEADDYVEKIIRKRYEGEDAQSIIENMLGKLEGKELYDMVQNYLDDDAIIQDYKDNEDYGYKKEVVADSIYRDIDLQREILENNKNNVLKLAELFAENSSSNNISDEYEFQKLYIEEYVKDYIDGDEDSYDEKERGDLRAKALKYLNDNFELDSDIETEYEKDMWMVSSGKYNL